MLKALKGILVGLNLRRYVRRFGRDYANCLVGLYITEATAEAHNWNDYRVLNDFNLDLITRALNSYSDLLKVSAKYGIYITYDAIRPLDDKRKEIGDIWG